MKRIFNPENYDIVPCSLCKNSDGFSVCTKCGGLGFIMKETQAPKIRKKSQGHERSLTLVKKSSMEDCEPHDL